MATRNQDKERTKPNCQRKERVVAEVNGRLRAEYIKRFTFPGNTLTDEVENLLAYVVSLSDDEAFNFRHNVAHAARERVLKQYDQEWQHDWPILEASAIAEKYDFDPIQESSTLDASKGPIEV